MAKRLRVLLSAYACEPARGSEPEVGWQWAIHLSRLHDVTVITRSNNQEPIERGLDGLAGPHPKFLYFDLSPRMQQWKKHGMPVALYYSLWQRAVTRHMADRIQGFDIVHHITFNSFRQPGMWRKCGKPIVLGPLGGGQICLWRLMGDFGIAAIGEWLRSTSVALNALNPYARSSFRDAAVILCANEDTANRIPKSYRHKTKMMLETGMQSLLCLEPREQTASNDTIRILWVGRMVPIKGAPLALRAFAVAHRTNPTLRMTMVGAGPDEPKLQRLITQLGLNNKVELTGKLELQRVKDLLPQHDIFLFTSLRDTSGNVLLEAMAAGLPAVTLRHHGAAQIATDKTALRIIPSTSTQTTKDLGNALATLAANPTMRQAMSKAAIDRIESTYTWEKKAQEMSRIYVESGTAI